MTTLTCPIAALMVARGRMTNQERIDQPLTQEEAARFVLESNSSAHVFAGLNRLMDIAFDLYPTDRVAAQALWVKIGEHMQEIDGALLGFNTLKRYALARVRKDLTEWAWRETDKRNPARSMPIAA